MQWKAQHYSKWGIYVFFVFCKCVTSGLWYRSFVHISAYFAYVNTGFMRNNKYNFTSYLKGGVLQKNVCLPDGSSLCFPLFSMCLWAKTSMQALLIVAYQVSSDLHSVDASLFTTFDVHKNTLDLCFGAEWHWSRPPRHHLCTQIVKCKLICKKMPH